MTDTGKIIKAKKIAEAFGWERVEYRAFDGYDRWFKTSGWFLPGAIERGIAEFGEQGGNAHSKTLDGKYFSGFPEVDVLPDFSTPEWQIKIQEKVGKEWCDEGGNELEVSRYGGGTTFIFRGPMTVTDDIHKGKLENIYVTDTTVEGYRQALLWLAERRGK
jgi:hypothetical protein